MPGSTPRFAIPYPCEGEAITTATFASYATAVEAAFVNVNASATTLTHLPYALVSANFGGPPAVGVDTTGTLTAFASSGMTVGATTVTVITPGPYQISVNTPSQTSSLTLTSSRLTVFVNANGTYSRKYNNLGASSAPMNVAGVVNLAVGDTVSFHFIWTGTGVLNGFLSYGSIQLLATP